MELDLRYIGTKHIEITSSRKQGEKHKFEAIAVF